LHFVQSAWPQLEPKQARWINRPRQDDFAGRHDGKAKWTEEAFGADEDDAVATDSAAGGDRVTREG
jgi:hypothetical protein